MKGKFTSLLVTGLVACGVLSAQSTELSDEEYSYVTMDLQGVLDLTMTTNNQVDFSFTSISDYKNGIVKYNAVQLEVDATVAWDLYVYAASDIWTPVETFSSNGTENLPAEILMISSNFDNTGINGAVGLGETRQSLRGITNAGISGGDPSATTQFIAGDLGKIADTGDATDAAAPGTAAANSDTHKFRLNYALYPGIPATFNNHGETEGTVGGVLDLKNLIANGTTSTFDYAKAGYYYLEVVYSLVEDL